MKDKTSAGLLSLFLGGFGAHKFYLGETGTGVIYLVFCWTMIPSLIGIIEGIKFLTMPQQSFDHRFNSVEAAPMLYPGPQHALPPPPQNIVVNVAQSTGGAGEVATQLKALHDLKIAGALTDEEFQVQKRKLLNP